MKLSKNEAKELMEQVKLKYEVETFSDIHYRVEKKIDIYPTTGTYVILETMKSGKYNDLYMFLKGKLDIKKVSNLSTDEKVFLYLQRAKKILRESMSSSFDNADYYSYTIEIAKLLQRETNK